MCKEGRRIESRSVCLQSQIKINQKKFPRNSSHTNLECMSRGLMTEINNVCKTIRQEIYGVSRYEMLKGQ